MPAQLVRTVRPFRHAARRSSAVRWLATCLVAALQLPTPAGAQVQPDSASAGVMRVGEISVRAARPVTTAGGASALEVQLDSLRVPAAPTLEQVLRELPLVQVRLNSRGEAQFSLRGSGSDARQVAVLVDGVPLNLTWDARADLSVLPATAAGTLTLVRGLPSVLHGPNVLGGVVEVGVGHHPGRWMPPRSSQAGVDVESTGAWSASASAAAPVRLRDGWIAVRGGAGHRQRSGVAVPSSLGARAAGSSGLRANTDLRHSDGFAAVRWVGDDGAWATVSSAGFRAERGIAAELHAARPRFWRYPHVSRTVAVLSGGTGDRSTPFGGLGDLEASIGVDVGRSELHGFRDASYGERTATEHGDDRTITLRLLGDHTVGNRGELRGALTWADILHDERVDAGGQRYRQQLWSAGSELSFDMAPPARGLGALRVSLGAAADGAATSESGDKPPLDRLAALGARLGATVPAADGRLLLHAGVSRRQRFPALRELYSGSLGRFEPNPGLRAERLSAAEAGVTRALPAGELQVVAFYRSLHDAIERITLPDGRYRRVNAGESRSAGMEVVLSQRLGSVDVAGDLTVQRIRLYDNGGTGPRHAEYQPGVVAGLSLHAPLPFATRAGISARHTGAQYCANPDAPGEMELGRSTRVDLDVGRAVRLRAGGAFANLELRAAADNIGDAAIYDQCGLPQPGRTLRLQLRIR